MADCRSFAAEVCGELDLCYDKGASLALLSFGGEIAMSVKRRDNRNRILREGEYQRKDGRYRSRYLDEDSKEQNVYSWRLDKNDPMPKGKKREPSLREDVYKRQILCFATGGSIRSNILEKKV